MNYWRIEDSYFSQWKGYYIKMNFKAKIFDFIPAEIRCSIQNGHLCELLISNDSL